MALFFLALFAAGAIYYAFSVFGAIRSGDIETVKLIGRGTVRYSRGNEPIGYGCATIAHTLVTLGLGAVSVAMIFEMPVADWVAGAGIATAAISILARRRLDRLRAPEVLAAPDAEALLSRFPTASVTRVMRAAREQVNPADAGYRGSGSRAQDALIVALERALAAERRRRALPVMLAVSGVAVSAVALVVRARAEHIGLSWTYLGLGALLSAHTLWLSRSRGRELVSALPGLADRLARQDG
jgi:hypothetical protein